MKAFFLTLAVAVVPGLSASGALLFSDNFNTADNGSFDAASTAGRLSGTAAGETSLRSWGTQQAINTNQLLLPTTNSGGVRFENTLNDPGTTGAADRYDWAAGSAAGAITSAGGFIVAFDWVPADNVSDNWVSFQVGTINGDSGNLANGQTDYGILFRNNGLTERFDNGLNLGAGGSFAATAGGVLRQVQITYNFNSFADGTSVTAVSKVNGLQVASDSFTLDNNAGQFRMELGSIAANGRIDNLTISSIPEPSAIALAGLAALGGIRRRRR